tara:strand:- start:526 stop:1044 length:519 start_codon:yes stop_codon:yes gene_type:complete
LKHLKLYKINSKDQNLIFEWRKKKIVHNFLLKKKINQIEHREWFKKKLSSKKYSAWTIRYYDKKIGLTQIDMTKCKNVCNAGFYTISKDYAFLSFEIMNLFHRLIFTKLKFNKIFSYIAKKNINFRKLNKLNGYRELREFELNNEFIYTSLKKKDWLNSKGFIYFRRKYAKL